MIFLGSKVGKIQTKFLHRNAVLLDIMKYLRLSNFHNCLINMLLISSQPLSNLVANSNYADFCILGVKCPNTEIRPPTPKKYKKFRNCLLNTFPTSPQRLCRYKVKI